jgi:hypothetical protein
VTLQEQKARWTQGVVDASSTANAEAMDLIMASGVLNANATLDKLMQVSLQLEELERATSAGLRNDAWGRFITRAYVFNAVR